MHIAPTALHRPFEVRDLKMSPSNTGALSATIDSDGQRVTARPVVTSESEVFCLITSTDSGGQYIRMREPQLSSLCSVAKIRTTKPWSINLVYP